MHRSGTSAVAAVISARFGLPASRLAVPSNPAGQWERAELRPALESMLAWNRATWANPRPELEPVRLPGPLRSYAARTFARHCTEPFLWKDPRLCLTIDRWLEQPQERAKIVFVHRDPMAVSRSLTDRNQWTTAHGLALWERTNRNAIHRLGGREIFAVPYEQLLASPADMIDELTSWIGLPASTESRASAVELVRPQDPASASSKSSEVDRSSEVDASSEAGSWEELTKPQQTLAAYLRPATGQTTLELTGLGAESASTGDILGSPSAAALARQVVRSIRSVRKKPDQEVAGAVR